MQKKILNTLIILSQWFFSLALGVYILVPIYEPIRSRINGDSIYSPYEGWEKSPLSVIHLNNRHFIGTSPDSSISLSPFAGQTSILVLDTIEREYINPFLFGQTTDDLQFLLKKHDLGNRSIYSSHKNSVDSTFLLESISMQLVESKGDFDFIDQSLNKGNPINAIAGNHDSLFSFNLLMTSTASPHESIIALKEGRNLLAFSKSENFYSDLDKIPVIRNIQWENSTLKIDLSEKGHIRIISSAFELDTIANNLSLKLNSPKWFRFEVDFPEDEIFYLSNPFFRYSNSPFSTVYPKAKNQLTIFINLSWLIIIVLMNVFIHRLRKKYL